MSVAGFCLPAGYVERLQPAYAHDEDGVGFQPHVYDLAASLASMLRAPRVVDIGCGMGWKLSRLHPQFAVVGVDCGENLKAAAERFPFGRWIDADLEVVEPGLLVEEVAGAVLICADVIEHLVDPGPLLKALGVWLGLAKVALLSTPERVLCWGAEHNGPPPNPCHVREWSRVELSRYLSLSGLRVAFSGFTQTHAAHPETGPHQGCQTTLVVLQGGP